MYKSIWPILCTMSLFHPKLQNLEPEWFHVLKGPAQGHISEGIEIEKSPVPAGFKPTISLS